MWMLVSALAAVGAVWAGWTPDPGAARRAAVIRAAAGTPRTAKTSGPWTVLGARSYWWVSEAQAARLVIIGLSPAAYGQSLLMGMGLGAAAAYLLTRSLVAAALGAVIGWGYQAFRVMGRHARWQRDISRAVPDLVRLLTLRLNAGEPVSLAVDRIVPYLRGPLQVEWDRLVAQRAAGEPLDAALAALDDRVADRHLTAVLSRLRTYHRVAVPDPPFGDMADHLTRISLIQQQTRMRQLTAPLTWYALAGFLGVFMVLMAPALLREIQATLLGNPLF